MDTTASVPGIRPVSDWVSFRQQPHHLLSSETPFKTPFNLAMWRCDLMRETNPTDYYPRWADCLYLNHSRCSTSCRSEVIDPSLESCDSPLPRKPTLLPLGQPTVKGAPLEMDQTLDFSPSRDFDQSARPLARLGLGGASVFLGAFYLLFPTTPTPSTSFNSFRSYPTLNSDTEFVHFWDVEVTPEASEAQEPLQSGL